jgi:hypothetical protein
MGEVRGPLRQTQGKAAAPAAARREKLEITFPGLRSELGGQDRAIEAGARDLALTQPSWMTPGLSWGSGGARDRVGHAAALVRFGS